MFFTQVKPLKRHFFNGFGVYISNRSFVDFELNKFSTEDQNLEDLERNCRLRNHTNNVPVIRNLLAEYQKEQNKILRYDIREKLSIEIKKLPNDTHPRILSLGDVPQELHYESAHKFNINAVNFINICRELNTLRMDHLGNYTGQKSYYLMGYLAELEKALIQYALMNLKIKNFRVITVPDILQSDVIASCGMHTDGDRTQVTQRLQKSDTPMRKAITPRTKLAITLNFLGTGNSFKSLEFLTRVSKSTISVFLPTVLLAIYEALQPNYLKVYKLESGKCLSGTSEMALAGYFANSLFKETDLPLKVAAVSRCYRAETSSLHEEKGIYRVHNFTKVEMFSICSEKQSQEILEHFKDIEVELFRNLNLTFKVLDMPPRELGTPAYQKYDIEAWMPGRNMWGEISSCSNCTDYQAKRLNIKYQCKTTGQVKYGHTVNGTAAAIPRLLISLLESNQNDDCTILLPKVLNQFMRKEVCKYRLPETKFVKHIK